MKKIGFIASLLIFSILLIGCQKKGLVPPTDSSVIHNDGFEQSNLMPEGSQKKCENLIKKELISDTYTFFWKEIKKSIPYELIGSVQLERGRVPVRCIVPNSGDKLSLVVGNISDLELNEGPIIQLDYGHLSPTITAKAIEEGRKTILSYPYTSNGITQTHISEFGKGTPIFRKITYVGEEQTEKDKEWCELFPGQFEPFDECMEYLTEGVLIDENGVKKAFTNFKIMVGRYDEQTLMVMGAGF